jgi:methyl-accepting chemotaxis protein
MESVMKTLKVGTRLGLAFGLVLLITAAIAAIGVWRLGTLNDTTQHIATTEMQRSSLAQQFRTNINVNLVRAQAALQTSDPAFLESLKTESAATMANTAEILKKLEALVADDKGRKLMAGLAKQRETLIAVRSTLMAKKAAGEDVTAAINRELRPVVSDYLALLDKLVDHSNALLAQIQADAAVVTSGSQWALGIGAVVSVALGMVLAVLVTRSVLLQLGGEPSAAASLAQGVAAGDLSVTIEVKEGDATSLMAHLRLMQDSLVDVVSNVRENAEGVATASAQIAQGNLDLSQRTEEQASALQQTATSMEQLGTAVKLNADSARAANELAMSASTVAVKGGDVVKQVVDTMQGINDSSKKIGDIISVIDGIAFQTNILALNAAVEAARAGEQGRGFAVVASEVRSLAGRSADAAKEIRGLIAASVERVAQGTALVDQAGSTMAEVVASIQRVTQLMNEISTASAEQSTGVAQVGEAVNQMDQVTQQNAALVEESAASAMSLKSQAQQLVDIVAMFKLGQGRQ